MNHDEVSRKFKELLESAKESGELVGVSGDMDRYEVGFVDFVTEETVGLLCVLPNGDPNGSRFMLLDDVVQVECSTEYLERVRLLNRFHDVVFDKTFNRAKEDSRNLPGRLRQASELKEVVYLSDGAGSGTTGFVKEVGEDYVMVELLMEDGRINGTVTLRLDAVMRADFGRREEQIRSFLHKYRYKLQDLFPNDGAPS